MLTATLRTVGGSIMLAVPPAIAASLGLSSGRTVTIEINGREMVIKPARPRFSEKDLLAKCDPTIPFTAEDREWIDAPAVGLEIM
jgi:antitoxin ChpS